MNDIISQNLTELIKNIKDKKISSEEEEIDTSLKYWSW